MQINSDIRELVLDPLLRGELVVEVDGFALETNEGPVELDATLRCHEEDRIRVEVRDRRGRDLSGLFPKKTEFTQDDTLTAAGTIAGKVQIRIEGIWPPSNWSRPVIGSVVTTTARLSAGSIKILVSGLNGLPTVAIEQYLGHLNSGGGTDFSCALPEGEEQEYEHLAIFSGTKLKFRNMSHEWTENHSFWGGSSGWKTVSWDGEAVGGTFSLIQEGDHLKVGFRQTAGSLEDAKGRADALFFAIGYAHAINPWPTYLKVREGGRVIDEHLRAVRVGQGGFVPLREQHGHDSDAPTRLIAAVAGWFHSLPKKERDDLKHACWVLRSADHQRTPAPTQMAMIGAVIEGLFKSSRASDPPESFTHFQSEVIEWLKEIEGQGEGTERGGLAKRLAGYVSNWPYQDRRTSWKDTFGPLFPGREEWLNEIFSIYQKHRNPPAHGKFAASTKVPMDTLRARGRLAGFVNLVIAAKSGYEGPILESPFADEVIILESQAEARPALTPNLGEDQL